MPFTKICPICGKTFIARKQRIKTCSVTCGHKLQMKTIGGSPFSRPEVREKIKNTMLEKYGVEHIMKSKEHLEKAQQTQKSNHNGKLAWNTNKAKNTKIEKYGNTYFKDIAKLADHSKTNQNKRYKLWKDSLIKNNSKGSVSRVEERIFNELSKVFKNTKRQYYS